MKTYTIEIDCGETTCATSHGEFCSQLGSLAFGTKPVCMLFNDTPLYSYNGWLQRCGECLNKVK